MLRFKCCSGAVVDGMVHTSPYSNQADNITAALAQAFSLNALYSRPVRYIALTQTYWSKQACDRYGRIKTIIAKHHGHWRGTQSEGLIMTIPALLRRSGQCLQGEVMKLNRMEGNLWNELGDMPPHYVLLVIVDRLRRRSSLESSLIQFWY